MNLPRFLFRVTLWLIATALIPLAYGSGYGTFIPRNEARTGVEAASLLLLQREPVKAAFFGATGLTEKELREAIKAGLIETKPCGNCMLETAYYRDGGAFFHRPVGPRELVSSVNGKLFLPACGNPVRRLPTAAAMPTSTPTPRPDPPCRESVIYSTNSFFAPGAHFGGVGYDGTGFSTITSHHNSCWVTIQ